VLSLKLKERRQSPRYLINRVAKLQAGNGALPRECLITNMSDGGVRLHIEGVEVPDRFVLLISGEGEKPRPRDCRVIWRLGFEVGAEFVGFEPRLA
jgi:hypothetical protein